VKKIDAIKSQVESIEAHIDSLRKLIQEFYPKENSLPDSMIFSRAQHLIIMHQKLEREVK